MSIGALAANVIVDDDARVGYFGVGSKLAQGSGKRKEPRQHVLARSRVSCGASPSFFHDPLAFTVMGSCFLGDPG